MQTKAPPLKSKSLVFCSTPFQASVCMRLVHYSYLTNFDLVYLTLADTGEDRNYYDLLKKHANNSDYVNCKKRAPSFIYQSVIYLGWIFSKKIAGYDCIYGANISSLVFRIIKKKNKKSAIYSFDDGSGNITPCSLLYKNKSPYAPSSILGFVFNLMNTDQIRKAIKCHYTIYKEFENIVDEKRLVYVDPIQAAAGIVQKKEGMITFFIGQPFSEFLTDEEKDRLKKEAATFHIDYYIMHPREKKPILAGVEILDKKGKLAEDAIYDASNGRRIRILSAYSTVLFNISDPAVDKNYFSFKGSKNEMIFLDSILKTGATIISI